MDAQWIYPILVGAFLAAFGWLLRNAWQSIEDKIDDLESSFVRVTSDLATEHAALSQRVNDVDKRLARLESWRELVTLPDVQGRQRRTSDRLAQRQMEEET